MLAVIGSMAWRAVIGFLALKYASDGVNVDENLSPDSLSYLSNRAVGFIYLGLAAYPVVTLFKRSEPPTAWIRSTSMMMMFVVAAVFVGGMGGDPDGAHAVIPSLVLIDGLFVGRSQFRARWWEPPTWTAFLLVYLWYHRSNDLHLYEDILGEDNIGTMVPLMLAGTVLFAYAFWGITQGRKAVSKSMMAST